MNIKIISDEIANGKTSITHTLIAKTDTYTIKASIKSDKNPHKCTATLYAFDNNGMTWNPIHSIAPSNMETLAGLNGSDDIINQTRTDMDRLLKMAEELLD